MASIARRIGFAVVLAGLASGAWAADPEVGKFAGKFEGTGIAEAKSKQVAGLKVTARDFDVEIRETEKGFDLDWVTVEYRIAPGSSDLERKKGTVSFERTDKPGLYRGMPAGAVTDGTPAYWATIDGPTLIVRALSMTPEGHATVQVWTRKLSAKGDKMELLFRRWTEAEGTRQVKGWLARTAG